MGINSPLSWLHGGIGDQGIQSLNFQRYGGVSPLMQPRLDPSMLGLQPDMYQVMAAAASYQDTDPSKLSNQSLHGQPNVSAASLIQNQMLQQSHSQPKFHFQDNNVVSQAQILQQQLQLNQQFNDQLTKKMIVNGSQTGPTSEPQLTPLSSLTSHLQNFSDLIDNHMPSYNNSSMPQSFLTSFTHEGPTPLVSHSSSSKRVALDPQLPSKFSDFSALLPPFPGRDVSGFQGMTDSHNNLLFGANTDSSTMMLNGVSTFRNTGNENESPYAAPAFAGSAGTHYPHLNSEMTTSSCVDESGYLQSSENVDQTNPPPGTFVKVSWHVTFSTIFTTFWLHISSRSWERTHSKPTNMTAIFWGVSWRKKIWKSVGFG